MVVVNRACTFVARLATGRNAAHFGPPMNASPTVTHLPAADHEQVTLHRDAGAGYTGIIAVHSTVMGPAVGGTRLWHYPGIDAAAADALRLSRGMSYKNALAGLPFGGGKAVIMGPAPTDPASREALMRAHGRAIEWVGGRFVTGEDVGTTVADMETIAAETAHVAGRAGGVGDPSPFTARGVLVAMEAAADLRWGRAELSGRRVAIQGLGHVGMRLAELLRERGAELVVADVAEASVADAVARLGATASPVEDILAEECDIVAPCALGAVLTRTSVPRLRADIVCGAANNQLADPEAGDLLQARGVDYVPDYVANAGGVISGAVDIAGWSRTRMEAALEAIGDTVRAVFQRATDDGLPTWRAADQLAEDRLTVL